ncbi:MAG: N-acetylmuramoyl-L-alanine amidase [Treponema sp.]|nr:N-acetylmuramoyl-L-alanine amidase [Treponema sp.]
MYKSIGILLTLFLLANLLFAGPVHAQTRVYTLDETMRILYAANGDGKEEFRWDPFFREGSFIIGGHYGAFSTALTAGEHGFFMMDNRDIYPVPLPWQHKGELVFPERFIDIAKEAFARSISEDSSHYRIAAIIIDPGHGGRDSGASRTFTINGKRLNVVEKDITLNVSRQLRDMLTKAYPDKRILMTRESDITVSLDERPLMANAVPIRKNEAIIYISIHANASQDRNARGFEVWHLTPGHRRNLLDDSQFPDAPELRQIMNTLTEEAFITESIRIANSILDSLTVVMGSATPSRGLKANDWFVVRNSRMPAVLVELPFVSNRDDALLLTNDAYLHKLADALYKGIAGFIGDFERSGGFIATR